MLSNRRGPDGPPVDQTEPGPSPFRALLENPIDGGRISSDLQARLALQRSLCLALTQTGFDSAAPDALESFSVTVETYLESLVRDLKRVALSARREQPTPADFEHTLERFSLPIRSLRPQLRPAAAVLSAAAPDTFDPVPEHAAASFAVLPILAEELSGGPDREGREYIPQGLPAFPSLHTYRSTVAGQSDNRLVCPARAREDAAKSAKQGEDALRRLVRATKARTQKEARLMAEKDERSRESYRLWEMAMRGLPQKSGGAGADGIVISDHSIIISSDASFLRREVTRRGRRAGAVRGDPKVFG